MKKNNSGAIRETLFDPSKTPVLIFLMTGAFLPLISRTTDCRHNNCNYLQLMDKFCPAVFFSIILFYCLYNFMSCDI